jgi:hypothetical protein
MGKAVPTFVYDVFTFYIQAAGPKFYENAQSGKKISVYKKLPVEVNPESQGSLYGICDGESGRHFSFVLPVAIPPLHYFRVSFVKVW